MQIFIDSLARLRRLAQALGPYLMLEILLPGGTLVALLLFLHRQGKLNAATLLPRPALDAVRSWTSTVLQSVFALQPCFMTTSYRRPK